MIAHGLFGSARNWGAIAKRLRAGPAGAGGRHAQPRRQPAEPGARLCRHGGRSRRGDRGASAGRADLLGHSMGGKAAMVLALTGAGAGAPADRRRHRAGRLWAQPDRLRARDAGGGPRRRRRGARTPTRRWRPGARARGCAPSCCRASPSARGGARWKLNLEALAEQMPAIMGFPELARQLRRAGAVPDRREVGLRAPRALAAHPRALPGGRASGDRRRRALAACRAAAAFVAAVEAFLGAP